MVDDVASTGYYVVDDEASTGHYVVDALSMLEYAPHFLRHLPVSWLPDLATSEAALTRHLPGCAQRGGDTFEV